MDLTEEAKAPNSPLAAHAAVQAKLDAGASRALLEASIARWPGNPKLLLLKGDLLERQAQPREAALHYAALMTDPAIAVWAAGRLAVLLKGDPLPLADAAAVVRDVSRSDVDAKLKGALLNALLSHDDGEGTLLDMAGTLSSLFQYELRLAVRRTERKDFAGALGILEAARDAGRVSVRSAVLMAELLRLEGRLPDAIGMLEELLPQHGDQPELLRQLTMMLQRAGITRARPKSSRGPRGAGRRIGCCSIASTGCRWRRSA